MRTKTATPKIKEMSDVFGLFKNTELADALKVGPSTLSEMKRRGNIPPEYWPRLIVAVREKGRDDVTFEKMTELAVIRAKASKRKRVAA